MLLDLHEATHGSSPGAVEDAGSHVVTTTVWGARSMRKATHWAREPESTGGRLRPQVPAQTRASPGADAPVDVMMLAFAHRASLKAQVSGNLSAVCHRQSSCSIPRTLFYQPEPGRELLSMAREVGRQSTRLLLATSIREFTGSHTLPSYSIPCPTLHGYS